MTIHELHTVSELIGKDAERKIAARLAMMYARKKHLRRERLAGLAPDRFTVPQINLAEVTR